MSVVLSEHPFLADASLSVLAAAMELDPCSPADRATEILWHAEEFGWEHIVDAGDVDLELAVNTAAHAVTFVAELIAARRTAQAPEPAK